MEFDDFLEYLSSPIDVVSALIAIGFSLIASVIVYLMYQYFYGTSHIGVGVHRSFIIGGPAITTLFLGIQTSIPLSLGLLGALSFVRFRTPVKDPAEIGFLLLLIATSIGAATGNFLLTVLLLVLVIVALFVHRLVRNRISLIRLAHLMIALEQEVYMDTREMLEEFLSAELPSAVLDTVSVVEDRVTLRYRYRRTQKFDSAEFIVRLKKLVHPAPLETYLG